MILIIMIIISVLARATCPSLRWLLEFTSNVTAGRPVVVVQGVQILAPLSLARRRTLAMGSRTSCLGTTAYTTEPASTGTTSYSSSHTRCSRRCSIRRCTCTRRRRDRTSGVHNQSACVRESNLGVKVGVGAHRRATGAPLAPQAGSHIFSDGTWLHQRFRFRGESAVTEPEFCWR